MWNTCDSLSRFSMVQSSTVGISIVISGGASIMKGLGTWPSGVMKKLPSSEGSLVKKKARLAGDGASFMLVKRDVFLAAPALLAGSSATLGFGFWSTENVASTLAGCLSVSSTAPRLGLVLRR